MDLWVEVTQEDIDNAKPQWATACAIQRAVARTLGEEYRVSVGETVSIARKEQLEEGIRVRYPAEVGEFMWAFDRGEKVEPIEFVLKGVTI